VVPLPVEDVVVVIVVVVAIVAVVVVIMIDKQSDVQQGPPTVKL
jgi:hypothetical protein